MQHDVVCELICEFLNFKSKLPKKDLNQNHKSQEMISIAIYKSFNLNLTQHCRRLSI